MLVDGANIEIATIVPGEAAQPLGIDPIKTILGPGPEVTTGIFIEHQDGVIRQLPTQDLLPMDLKKPPGRSDPKLSVRGLGQGSDTLGVQKLGT